MQRLPLYLRCLESLDDTQVRVSSEELAGLAQVNPAKVRKDLSYLGTFGVRGVGYDVDHLRFQIRTELGLERDWHVVIVGVGSDMFKRWLKHQEKMAEALSAQTAAKAAQYAAHTERLEQLRVLEHGHTIAVAVAEAHHVGIDTPEQYAAFVARWLASAGR